VLWQMVVLCRPDGKRHTLAGVIDNLLQSLDSSMEISELMSKKEAPKKKKCVVEDSSSSEEEELSSEEEEDKTKKKSYTKKKLSKRPKVGGWRVQGRRIQDSGGEGGEVQGVHKEKG